MQVLLNNNFCGYEIGSYWYCGIINPSVRQLGRGLNNQFVCLCIAK